MVGVNASFALVTEEEISQVQNSVIPNKIKKTTILGMKVFIDKQCFNKQFANLSVFCPY